jgi:hypothetical protein
MGRPSIILGSLLNLFSFDPASIACFDSVHDPAASPEGILDEVAQIYLADVLAEFGHRSVRLVPVSVQSDGSCLTNAISSSLTSSEMFYDVLRASLIVELDTASTWYRKHSDMLVLDDEDFADKLREAMVSAMPTRGKR